MERVFLFDHVVWIKFTFFAAQIVYIFVSSLSGLVRENGVLYKFIPFIKTLQMATEGSIPWKCASNEPQPLSLLTYKRIPVNARHVDHYVNHFTAQLVRLHVYWRSVSCNVYFARNIEKKRFLYSRILQQKRSSHANSKLKLDSFRLTRKQKLSTA